MSTPPLPPSFPPPHFPPPPGQAPPPKSKAGCWIAGIVGGVLLGITALAVVGSLAVPAYNAIKKKAEATQRERAGAAGERGAGASSEPLSEEELARVKAFGDELAELINTQQLEAANDLTDVRALEGRVFDSMDLPAGFQEARSGFRTGVESTGLLTQVANGQLSCLKAHQRDGHAAVLMRVLPNDGGVNYIDLLLRREGDSYRVVDIFNYLFGSHVSSEARQAMSTILQDTNLVGKILGVPSADSQAQMKAIQSQMNKMRSGDYQGSVEDYRGLPEKTQETRVAFVTYLQCLQMLQSTDAALEEEYLRALERAPGILKDSATELLALDMRILRKDWPAVYEGLERIRTTVADDPYLTLLKGNVQILEGDIAGAERSAEEVAAREPELVPLIDLRLAVHCARKDHAAVVLELRGLKERFGSVLLAEDLTEPQYEAFLASPEYKAWEEEHQ